MVEQALLQQLTEALPENYLKTYKNNDTNNITTYLNIILDKLLSTYGNVTDEDVEQNETELLAKIFDITQPLVNLYQEVEDLQQLATTARSPFSDK